MNPEIAVAIDETTIGEAWIAIARRIMDGGTASTYDGLAIREVLMTTVIVRRPATCDDIVERFASAERLAWMRANFRGFARVAELGDADSYATRLRNYAGTGLDQVQWVIDRLRRDPLCRSATITTFQPLSESSYIPCVSLLDFFYDGGELHLVVYAHSIDFGTKGYANLLELATIQDEVANQLECPPGSLTMIVKSAHVYGSDESDVLSILADFDQETRAGP